MGDTLIRLSASPSPPPSIHSRSPSPDHTGDHGPAGSTSTRTLISNPLASGSKRLGGNAGETERRPMLGLRELAEMYHRERKDKAKQTRTVTASTGSTGFPSPSLSSLSSPSTSAFTSPTSSVVGTMGSPPAYEFAISQTSLNGLGSPSLSEPGTPTTPSSGVLPSSTSGLGHVGSPLVGSSWTSSSGPGDGIGTGEGERDGDGEESDGENGTRRIAIVHGPVGTPTFASDAIIKGWKVVGGKSWTGGGKVGAYVVYDISISLRSGGEINILRRYTDFVVLRELLKERFPYLRRTIPSLPGKNHMSKFSPDFLSERQTKLQRFLRTVILHPETGRGGVGSVLGQWVLDRGEESNVAGARVGAGVGVRSGP